MEEVKINFGDEFEGYEFKKDDKEILQDCKTPLSVDEPKRLEILRQTKLFHSQENEPGFDRFTSLCNRLFNVSDYN